MTEDWRVLVVLALTLNPSALTQSTEGFSTILLTKADGQLLKKGQASLPLPATWRDTLDAFKRGIECWPHDLA